MARRPRVPRPRPGSVAPSHGAPSAASPRSAPSAPSAPSARSARSARSVPSARSAPSAPSARTAPSAPSARSAASPSPPPRPRSRAVGRPQPGAAPAAPSSRPEERAEGGRVVQAAGRFRELVVGRPWRRRRRAIIAGSVITVLVLVAAFVTAIFLPALQVRDVTVAGTEYVPEESVLTAAAPHTRGSVLLLRTGAISQEVAEVPGVDAVEVERDWPHGARITITETEPIAVLARTDGSTAVVDAHGEELPAAAGEGRSLVPLAVESGAADPEGAARAMSEVLAEMPGEMRGAVQEVTASSTSDVTLEIALEDGGAKTVVWGDAQDAELKAEVVQALLGRPGGVIDVSSPVAHVTR